MRIGRYEILPNTTDENIGKKYQITSKSNGCTKRYYFNNYRELFIYALKVWKFKLKMAFK